MRSRPAWRRMIQRDVDRLQRTHTNSGFSEVGVGINQDFELAEHADQKVCKVPVNHSGQAGP